MKMRTLQRLKVTNFKSIREQELLLRPLNVFIGGNGSLSTPAGGGGQYTLPNNPTTNSAPPDNGRNNVPMPGITQPSQPQQPQGQPNTNNNSGAPRAPTASLPLPLPN